MRVLSLLALALLVLPASARALPEYAARENKACAYCHLDPGGGGPRGPRGQYYEAHDHSFEGFDEASVTGAGTEKTGATASPLQTLLEALSFSGNLRVCYSLADGPHNASTSRCESCHARGERAPDQTFFIMQGELAVTARVSDQVSFTYSNDQGITRDLYAVLRFGPESGAFVKAGEFEVPYGSEEIKDHNTLVKSRHNIGSNLRDVGVQVAVQKPRTFLGLALLNGGERFPDSAPVFASFDRNGSPAVVLRGGVLGSRFRIGGSAMYEDSIAGSRPRQTFGGVFASYFAQRWHVSAEGDVGQNKLGGVSATNIGFVAELDVEVFSHFNIGGKVDWYDPNNDLGSDIEAWYTAILEQEIGKYASVEARFRIRDEQGPEIANDDIVTMLNVNF